jgi:hypothetical protein
MTLQDQGRNPRDVDGVADHVAGAALLGASGNSLFAYGQAYTTAFVRNASKAAGKDKMDLAYNQRPRFTEWVARNGFLESPFVFIDAGVQGGIHPRWNFLGPALKVYGFDPLEETIAPLTRLNLPNHEYHAVALGDEDGERDFFVTEILPASSFFSAQIRPRPGAHGYRRR